MADVTIYKPSTLTVNVVDGEPPVDQGATVAQLTTDLAAANATISDLKAEIATARAAAQSLLAALQ